MSAVDALSGVLSSALFGALSGGPVVLLRGIGPACFDRAIGGGLRLTAAAVAVSLVIGVAVALRLSRLPVRRRSMGAFVIAVPLTFSGLVVACGLFLVFGRAEMATPWPGLALASSAVLIPRVVMVVLPAFVHLDPALLEAAESLGATSAQAFRQVLLPPVRGAVIAAACLVAVVVFGGHGAALVLVGAGPDILPLQSPSRLCGGSTDFPAAPALALLIMAGCSSIIALGEWAAGRADG